MLEEFLGVFSMEYGYVRNSTNNEKSIEKQKEELLKYAKEQNVVVDDTGEQFRAMLAKMQNGDSIHVMHTDRITKNPEVLLSIIKEMMNKDVSLIENGEKVDLVKLEEQLSKIVALYISEFDEEEE